ncbi:hypothetical protein D3C75_640510 [compost metagenome]
MGDHLQGNPLPKPHSPADPYPAHTIWQALELPVRGSELIEAVNRGLPCAMLQRLAAWLVIPLVAGLQCVGISPSTWRRRVQSGCLSVQESDRLYRFVVALDLAIELFEGDKAAAYAWLRRPQRGLANHSAIDLLATSVGTDAIHELIGRLEHGVMP